MRILLVMVIISMGLLACGGSKTKETSSQDGIVCIANDTLEYEIIISEPGFQSWLLSQPKRGFYSQPYLENKNQRFVTEYNYRVSSPRFSRDSYPQRIEYDPDIDYGYEVNYLLYNYFVYFQNRYNQTFIGIRN